MNLGHWGKGASALSALPSLGCDRACSRTASPQGRHRGPGSGSAWNPRLQTPLRGAGRRSGSSGWRLRSACGAPLGTRGRVHLARCSEGALPSIPATGGSAVGHLVAEVLTWSVRTIPQLGSSWPWGRKTDRPPAQRTADAAGRLRRPGPHGSRGRCRNAPGPVPDADPVDGRAGQAHWREDRRHLAGGPVSALMKSEQLGAAPARTPGRSKLLGPRSCAAPGSSLHPRNHRVRAGDSEPRAHPYPWGETI